MKTIFAILCSMLILTTYNQKEKKITAVFDSYEHGTYYFIENEETTYEFETVNKDVMKVYNLKNEKYLNETFKITYKEEIVIDEEDEEEYSILKITKLELLN